MKRSIVLSLMLVFAVFMASETNAQKTKKKTSSSTTKKSTTKKTKKGSKSTKEPVVEVPVATPEPIADVPPEDTGVSTPDIVADSEAFNFSDVTLDTTKPKDGYLKLAHLKGAKPFPLPENNKNSVNFYKRIWREINVADSENRIFSIPGETLIQFIMDGIKAGKVYAYADDAFTKKLTYAAVMKKFKDSVIVPLIDSNGDQYGTKNEMTQFNPDSITKFELKEDIYFDKVRGRVTTEIIAFGPVRALKNSSGVFISDQHPFYLNFKNCRGLFAAREVVDPQRDLYNISFDDIFIQHAFKSLIVKESNPANQSIKDKFPERKAQIRESNRIEREIQRYKRNLWKFS